MTSRRWPLWLELSCGCKIRVRTTPIGPTQKYACRSNLGHSYNQSWASYKEGGLTFVNSQAKK